MVLQKRLDYGFNGYQAPPTPRAARSVRRRCLFKSKADVQQMCAFDLLATVAGKLLLEGGNSPPLLDQVSKKEQLVEGSDGKQEKTENILADEKSCDQDSYERNFLAPDPVTENPNAILPHNDPVSRPASGITTSNCPEKHSSAEHLANDDCKLRLGIFTSVVNPDYSACKIFANNGSDDEIRKHIKMESSVTPNSSTCNGIDLCHPVACDKKPSRLVNSVDDKKLLFCGNHSPCGPPPVNRDNKKLVARDDDDNSSGFTESQIRIKTFRPSPPIGDSKIRKLLASRPHKVAPPVKDDGRYNADAERCKKHISKRSFKRQRSPRDYPFKKRKFYVCSSMSDSDEGNSGGAIGSSPTLSRRVIKTQDSAAGERASFHTSNPQVKLKIRSFRVPELVIEIPETATVGSLKKTVMDAVNAILGGGLRVGVLLQGKMIRDDNITLSQSGISQDKKMDMLGFSLEPSISQAPLQSFPDNRPCQLLHNDPQPLVRYTPATGISRNGIQHGKLGTPPDHAGNDFDNFVECDHDSVLSPPEMSLQKPAAQLKAIVPVPKMEPDALAMVPLKKSKRSDSVQRRIRRPFTVSEVEALVQAVEKLGTGRWRDVKLSAFDSAKHRTYVDLKDKWKTLVHTARISPQQRRGEPVPQELLDRVLATHAYWSQQHAKQHLKSQLDTCLLL
ncbi:telomere repeat-binding protein 5 [Dorcoceras hygrometricum]|uniref:Telomere repeat-binding protein 5 n=1 Tax=Dorcoceras hygrometricum TaxID=472368 RepID=A0A2Z7D8J6_9LAMI|nr:telomere repeat-binding protein 5 [Dorcoceras hygrometricum]